MKSIRVTAWWIKWYLTYMTNPAKMIALEDEADQAADLAELHDRLRRQAEQALAQERERSASL